MPLLLRYASLVLLVLVSPCSTTVMATPQSPRIVEDRKAELEVEKLQLQIAKLRERSTPVWIPAVIGVLAGIATAASSLWVARRARSGTLDQAVHTSRLETYQKLVAAAAPLAIYFPPGEGVNRTIGPASCAEMGRAMSEWYFARGGLLLSEDARNAYFKLMRALTRASLAADLSAPSFPRDAERISAEKVRAYRDSLGTRFDLTNVDGWVFGGAGAESVPAEVAFKDYVFLQQLSSELRTALSEDLRSRRRPSS